MTQLSSLAVVDAHQSNTALPSQLIDLQKAATTKLASLATPTRKTEHWKYSAKRLGDLNALRRNTAAADVASTHIENGIEINVSPAGFDTEAFAAINERGLHITRFSELNADECTDIIELAQYERGELEHLNTALFNDALVIHVAKSSIIERPIVVNFAQDQAGLSTPRVFIKLEQSAQATLVENYAIEDIEGAFCATQTTALVGDNAKLSYLRMSPLGNAFKLGGATRVILKRDANFESHALCLGTAMARHDFHVLMTGQGAHCDLNGVVVTKEKQHFDNHTEIEHIAAHCTSEENYRCIADDSSHIVFNGRIYIHKDAQKTLGEMNNRNLLLSNTAAIDTKPELEIYADDVKCAHGATIGQLDEKEVYYLKTRGLTDEQARQMLTLGFVLELVRAVPISELAESWESTLSALLSFKD